MTRHRDVSKRDARRATLLSAMIASAALMPQAALPAAQPASFLEVAPATGGNVLSVTVTAHLAARSAAAQKRAPILLAGILNLCYGCSHKRERYLMAIRSTQKRALTPKETRAQQNWRLANLRRAGLPVPPRGQRTKYKEEYVDQAEKLCAMGATDAEIARFFDVSVPTLSSWAAIHEDFGAALQKGGVVADATVERSLYQRAIGYSYESEKIIGEVIRAPIVVHVPPDVKAQIFWLKNRDPKNWRDRREAGMDGKTVTTAINATMTPQQAAEAFAATIRGAVLEAEEP